MSNWNGTILGPPHVCQIFLSFISNISNTNKMSSRACTRTEFTPWRCIAAITTPTSHQRSNLSARSTCLASTQGMDRSVSYCTYIIGSTDFYFSRSTLPSCHAWLSGRGNILWRLFWSTSEGGFTHITFTMNILLTQHRYMAHPAHKKIPQPAEGSTYAL